MFALAMFALAMFALASLAEDPYAQRHDAGEIR
jgi:hypothetical protein